MKFEEILPLMREGKKATHKSFDANGEYWIVGYAAIPIFDIEKYLIIIRMNKDGKALNDVNSWGIPRWLVMSDEWEIIE